MADFKLQDFDAQNIENFEIAKDCLEYLRRNLDSAELHKFTKRRAINQAAYGVAKVLGHRSSYHDLYLSLPGMKKLPTSWTSELWNPVPPVTKVGLYFQINILGKESLKGFHSFKAEDRMSGNITVANQVDINIQTGTNTVTVEMNMTGPALLQLCSDVGKLTLGRALVKMLAKKWGSTGSVLGRHAPMPFGREDTSTQPGIDEGKEGRYVYARWVNGIPKVKTSGFGWMSAT